MQLAVFKNLTLFIFVIACLCHVAYSSTFTQEKFNTHLRWNLDIHKDQIVINKEGLNLEIQTLNIDIFNQLVEELSKLKLEGNYFVNIAYDRNQFPVKPATISVSLKSTNVEMFSFYKQQENKYVVDFWINDDIKFDKPVVVQKPKEEEKPKLKKVTKTKKAQPKKVAKKVDIALGAAGQAIDSALVQNQEQNEGYRDFRYGASFIWDYPPYIPQLDKDINLSSKTPEYFYPIQNREYEKDEKEAHMQLSVNLFKKEKWGLLAKSINLYEQKYGVDSNHESNEYLKANALLRKNIKEKNKGVQAAANNILNSLLESTQNYDLRKAVGRYLIQEALDRGDYINSLGLSRKLFFESKKEFDKELTIYTSTIILHSLAELKQNEKINDFLADKYINKILPSQIGLAYNSYALLVRGDNTEVIRNYEKNMKGLVKPLHPAILFNTAEAYFRESKFDESIALFDEFVKEYSHIREAGQARLRIALAYEVSNKSIQKVTTLYKDAIDRAQSAKVRYEAKLRYLGVVLNRKIELTTEDNEKTIFFEMTPDERVAIDDELKKLLWLVRLRTYINQSQYQKALTYLVSIPLNSLKPTKRRAFQADGAEIIYGLLKQAYNNENYSRVVKLWETYKITYDKNVAMNPHANFVVASSYLKLGLHKSFDRVLSNFKELESYTTRIYPKWVNRGKEIKIANMLKELLIVRHIEDNDWKVADKMLETLSSNDRKDINYSYYRGSIDYALKNYEKAANNFEHMLVNQNKKNLLDLSQLGNLLVKYIEALHQTNQKERLINTAAAILKDISSAKTNNASLASAQERIHYLLIENFYASKNTAFPKLEKESKKFLKEFSKSNYKDRVKYLYGLAMIKNLKVEQGSEILNSLISDKEVPGYLKEMAKTELSAVKIGVGI